MGGVLTALAFCSERHAMMTVAPMNISSLAVTYPIPETHTEMRQWTVWLVGSRVYRFSSCPLNRCPIESSNTHTRTLTHSHTPSQTFSHSRSHIVFLCCPFPHLDPTQGWTLVRTATPPGHNTGCAGPTTLILCFRLALPPPDSIPISSAVDNPLSPLL